MDYRSLSDLARAVKHNLHRIPNDIDLIVGVSSTGMLAGNLISLSLAVPITDIDSFISNGLLTNGKAGISGSSFPKSAGLAKHVLVVTDNNLSGKHLSDAVTLMHRKSINQKFTTCSVYTNPAYAKYADIYFEEVSSSVILEWNLMHDNFLTKCCVDIDGVFSKCYSPNGSDNKMEYPDYLEEADPLYIPSVKVGYIVTNRPEKYREITEKWLQRHNIRYKELHMLPDTNTRYGRNVFARFKAEIYKKKARSRLFIETDQKQAVEIARLAAKPVLCFSNQKICTPDLSLALIDMKLKSYKLRAFKKAKKFAGQFRSLYM